MMSGGAPLPGGSPPPGGSPMMAHTPTSQGQMSPSSGIHPPTHSPGGGSGGPGSNNGSNGVIPPGPHSHPQPPQQPPGPPSHQGVPGGGGQLPPHSHAGSYLIPQPTPSPGGDMSPGTSPNDPVFFLNHCNVDRIWQQWMERHGQNYAPGRGQGPQGHRIDSQMFSLIGAVLTPEAVLDPTAWYAYDHQLIA